ncbi:MAG: hypothetical protein WC138_02675 [Methanoculleus sp.]
MNKSSVLLILLLLMIPAATAASVTITPTTIDPGDTVTVNVKDLSENATFSLGISAEFDVTAGDTFSFRARDLTLPFALDQGKVNAYTKGTNWTEISAPLSDGGSATLRYYADDNGETWLPPQSAGSISSGTYGVITLSGEATAKSIITRLEVTGKKKGASDGTISFALDGIESGTATVAVYIDGSEALSQKIAIGSAPVETETPSPGGNGGNGGSSGSSGSSGPSTPTPAPATTTSVDGKVSLTGTDIDGAGLLSRPFEGAIPPGWSAAGRIYAVTPADRVFGSPAVLSFSLPSAETAATIAQYENGAWSAVPSRIEGDRITATISRGGSYVVLVPAQVPTQTATTTTTTTTPVATTPAATPLAPLLPVLACAILMLAWGRRV